MKKDQRKAKMADLRELARSADARGDVVMRRQYADTWRELATDAEAKKAPKHLTWTGR